MAENESLDLRLPGARRWFEVSRCVRDGSSAEKIAEVAAKVHAQAIGKVLMQLRKLGVSPDLLYAARNDPTALRKLAVQAQGHPYFRLMQDELRAAPDVSRPEFHLRWMRSAIDKVTDQIVVREASAAEGTNLFQVRESVRDAVELLVPSIEGMAQQLDKNPRWRPTRRLKGDVTQTPVLQRSLMG